MSDYYVGEIRMFGGAYAPQGWMICNGQSLSVSGYQLLFTLIGTTYGGDGVSTFNLPNLQGCVPIGQGQGTGLTNRVTGQNGGEVAVTLGATQIPAHTHTISVIDAPATQTSPSGALLAQPTNSYVAYLSAPVPAGAATYDLASTAVASNPGGNAHNNVMPSMGLTFMIAVNGIYPVRA